MYLWEKDLCILSIRGLAGPSPSQWKSLLPLLIKFFIRRQEEGSLLEMTFQVCFSTTNLGSQANTCKTFRAMKTLFF